jgi:hypothetical protein
MELERSFFGKSARLLMVSVLTIGGINSGIAQQGGVGGSDTQAAAVASSVSATPNPKPNRAQRKAARKQARAKRNSELKTLEDAGYRPSQGDPNYPENLQEAQKKAASQGTGQ